MTEHVDRPSAGDEPEPPTIAAGLARPGAITYLHIGASDVRGAAAFYGDVFGWTIRGADGDRPSFEDTSGRLSGAWIRREHALRSDGGPGLLPYVYVEDVAETVDRIVDHGGTIVADPFPEGALTVATFRDPAGNLVGLWHDTSRSGAAVTPVPEHLHTVTPRLAVADAGAAIDFYVAAFDARELGERHLTPDGTLVHAELGIGDSVVMITEDDGYAALLCTYWSDVDAAWERALAAGAQVVHPLADQIYGERGGRVRDPFGQEWMLSARLERLTVAQIVARMAQEHASS